MPSRPALGVVTVATSLLVAAILGAAVVVAPKVAAIVIVGVAAGYFVVRGFALVAAAPMTLVTGVALMSFTIIKLPVMFGNGPAPRLVVLGPFVVASVMLGARKVNVPLRYLAPLMVWGGLVCVALIRGSQTGAYATFPGAAAQALALVVAAWFWWRYLATASSSDELKSRLRILALAPASYAAVNLVMWAGGVSNGVVDGSLAIDEPAQLLALAGIHVGRVSFPLGVSINNFGVICAVGLAGCLVLLARDRDVPAWATIGGAVACVACLLLGDSRVSFFAALLASAIIVLFPRVRAASGLAILAPLAPIVLIAVAGYFASTTASEGFSGADGRDVASASGRSAIWGAVWHHVEHGSLKDLVGYGAAGQKASGVSSEYSFMFEHTADPLAFPVHNAMLQQLMDTGYIGLLALLAVFVSTLRRLPRTPPGAALFAGVVTLLFSGITEVTPSYYSVETMVFLAAAAVAAAVATATATASDPVTPRVTAEPTPALRRRERDTALA